MSDQEEQKEKKILNKFEWFLLILSVGIIIIVLLQNQGINMIETTERVEITAANDRERYKKSTPFGTEKESKDHLKDLSSYFSKNRAQAQAEGKSVGFDWASLVLPADEEAYLKNKYGDKTAKSTSTDWFSVISKSHKTYKSVKSAFKEVGIDTDKLITAENASKALSNPIIANSIYNKMEKDFGIPAEKSRSFAEKRKQTLEKWAEFVEEEMPQ